MRRPFFKTHCQLRLQIRNRHFASRRVARDILRGGTTKFGIIRARRATRAERNHYEETKQPKKIRISGRLRAEYDFSKGFGGKHAAKYADVLTWQSSIRILLVNFEPPKKGMKRCVPFQNASTATAATSPQDRKKRPLAAKT
jgi:hypothetical protein